MKKFVLFFLVLFLPCLPVHGEDLVIDSPEEAVSEADALSEADFSSDTDGEKVSPYELKQIIVKSDSVDETYGAVNSYLLEYSGETLFEYCSEEETRVAYEALSQEYDCILNEKIETQAQYDTSGESGLTIESVDQILGISEELKAKKLSDDILVAVLDTGISDKNSSYFSNRISSESYDFVNNVTLESEGNQNDSDGHGTHVAGIITQSTPENTYILSCRMAEGAESSSSDILRWRSALQYAILKGADVINISFQISDDEDTTGFLDDIIEDAWNQGIIICVAAGNDGQLIEKASTAGSAGHNYYPASNSQVVTVGSVKPSDSGYGTSSFSNYGPQLDFTTPGEGAGDQEGILSASADGSAEQLLGTSQATPFIASCFAYLKGYDSSATATEYIAKLKSCCFDPEKGRGNVLSDKDEHVGWGMPYLADLGLSTESTHHYKTDATRSIDASCTEAGRIFYVCSDEGCGESYSKTLPATGHNWKVTFGEDGSIRLACQNKGCHMEQTIEKKKEITLDDGSTETMLDYGVCGDDRGDVIWAILNEKKNASGNSTVTLYLSGKGGIKERDAYPWEKYASQIISIKMSDGITAIPAKAFMNETYLTSISSWGEDVDGNEKYISGRLPDSLLSIGEKAFFRCRKLSGITLNDSLATIGDGAFAGCRKLSFTEENNPYFMVSDDHQCICDSDGRKLLFCNTEDGSFSSTVTEIGPYAFCESNISSIAIPFTVSKIDDYAFAGCGNLAKISMEMDSEPDISENAFYGVVAKVYVSFTVNGTPSYGGSLEWITGRVMMSSDNTTVTLGQKIYSFDGNSKTPSVSVVYNGTVLTENVDYKVGYYDNISPGDIYGNDPRVVIEGIGDYYGSITRKFTIKKSSFNFNSVTKYLETVCSKSDGAFELPSDGLKLTFLSAADLKFEIVAGSGDGDLKFTESDDESGMNSTQTILPAHCGKVTLKITSSPNEYYADYTAMRYTLSIDHNWITKTKKAGFLEDGQTSLRCSYCDQQEGEADSIAGIGSVSLDKAVWTYTGSAIRPAVKVLDTDGKIISHDNYTVTYPSSLKKVGRTDITVVFKGNYSGTKKLSCLINPRGTTLKSLKAKSKSFAVTWKKNTSQTTGYQIRYSLSRKMTKSIVKTVKNKKRTALKVKKLKSRKKYYVQIRTFTQIGKKKYYSNWSKKKTVITK